MAKRSCVLLVSPNAELHRTLHLVTSTYNFKLVGTEDPKKGVGILKSNVPNCVIFDLQSLRDPKHKNYAKRKVEESGVPSLLLNDNDDGAEYGRPENGSVKLEPIVKFIMDNCRNSQQELNGGFVGRFFSFLKLKLKRV